MEKGEWRRAKNGNRVGVDLGQKKKGKEGDLWSDGKENPDEMDEMRRWMGEKPKDEGSKA